MMSELFGAGVDPSEPAARHSAATKAPSCINLQETYMHAHVRASTQSCCIHVPPTPPNICKAAMQVASALCQGLGPEPLAEVGSTGHHVASKGRPQKSICTSLSIPNKEGLTVHLHVHVVLFVKRKTGPWLYTLKLS